MTDVAPVASISGATAGVRGQACSFLVAAVDTSAADSAAGFRYTIAWGDGSPVQTIAAAPGNGVGVALDHVFNELGTYSVTVTATDAAGATGVFADAREGTIAARCALA